MEINLLWGTLKGGLEVLLPGGQGRGWTAGNQRPCQQMTPEQSVHKPLSRGQSHNECTTDLTSAHVSHAGKCPSHLKILWVISGSVVGTEALNIFITLNAGCSHVKVFLFFSLRVIYFYIMYMRGFLDVHWYTMCMPGTHEVRRGHEYLGTAITDGGEPPYVSWVSNPDPLQRQQVSLISGLFKNIDSIESYLVNVSHCIGFNIHTRCFNHGFLPSAHRRSCPLPSVPQFMFSLLFLSLKNNTTNQIPKQDLLHRGLRDEGPGSPPKHTSTRPWVQGKNLNVSLGHRHLRTEIAETEE